MTLGAAGWRHGVIGPVQHDRWHGDWRTLGQSALGLLETRLARGVAVAVAVGVNHHWDEIGNVEGRRREVIGTPSSGVTRAIMVLAGCVGVIVVGLVVAVSTRALKLAVEEEERLEREKLSCDKER